MTNKEYLDKLLSLCTTKQVSLFERMYPTGVKPSQIKHAVFQAENTLKSLNYKLDKRTESNNTTKKINTELTDEIRLLNRKIGQLNMEVKELTNENDNLNSDPVAVNNAEIIEKLQKLEALEFGGVDNWTWYGESMKNYFEGDDNE